MKRRIIGVVLFGGIVLLMAEISLAQAPSAGQAPAPAAAAQPASQAPAAMCADSMDTKAEVPALREMHEVIYPLWHQAWPNKDFKMMKELLPQVREHVEAVRTATLPGILRDKKADWDAGVSQLIETEKAYEDAAAKNDEQGLLDAVEKIHARFEGLMRVTWPGSKQLDDYHVVLYKIYHYSMPAKDLTALRTLSEELAAKAKILSEAPVPPRFAAKDKEIKSGITRLWADTEAFRMAAQKDDLEAINAAVEKMHTSYQTLDGLFH